MTSFASHHTRETAVLAGLVTVMLPGQCVLGMATDDLFGVVSGTAGNRAILAYASKAVQIDGLDAAFATICASTPILKIVCVQVAMGVFGAP